MNMTIRFEALAPGSDGGGDLDVLRSSIKAVKRQLFFPISDN
jgi:hypothetical protein